jgi:hypothetical protein
MMNRLIRILVYSFLLSCATAQGAFTEFYCNASTGSNLNSGSTEAAAVFSGVGDSDGTSVFTPSDGQTPASTVSVGMFGSVYVTSGATVAAFVGRITVVAAGVNGAVTFSTTAKSGTFPAASSGAHTITLVVGGPWKGPNAASGFPFGTVTNALANSSGDAPRINLKNNTTYSITAGIAANKAGPIAYQGYSSSVGDGGRAIIDGGTSGTSYVLLDTSSGTNARFVDLVFQNNGATGSADGVTAQASGVFMQRVIVNSVRGYGINASGGVFTECEVYGANQSNTGSTGGFRAGGSVSLLRCYIHDNTGSNTSGVLNTASGVISIIGSVIESNGKHGAANVFSAGYWFIYNTDFYNNGGSGFDASSINGGSLATHIHLENCNFVKNGLYGVSGGDTGTQNGFVNGRIENCGFGSGTQANTSGQTNRLGGIQLASNCVTYASGVTPWSAPTTGNFSITLAAAKNTGRGAFLQTGNSKTGTIGYPDIGAAQSQATGGETSHVWQQ